MQATAVTIEAKDAILQCLTPRVAAIKLVPWLQVSELPQRGSLQCFIPPSAPHSFCKCETHRNEIGSCKNCEDNFPKTIG